MRNFIPERMVRQTGRMMRMNIDDGDLFLGEFGNGALCSVQTSFVTVGNYPGIEARVYGSKGALICRLVEEAGVCETLRAATPIRWSSANWRSRRAAIRRAATATSRGGRSSTRTS
jgi:predicted dehydrogenase